VSQGTSGRVALVFQGEPDASLSPRLQPMSNALEAAGLTVTSVPFHHHHAADLRNRLADFGPGDGIVVWADPLGEGGDRRPLDRALRHAESTGAWVSARPDVIDKLGTKDVLVTTRSLGWGSDTHRYQDRDEFRRGFPARLRADGVRVLKATRGNGGRTVWKVRLPGGPARNAPGPQAPVIVQHARIRDGAATTMTLADAMHLIEEAGALDGWGGAGYLVDQEFIPGVTRGIVRCYLVGDAVVGFARQYPDGVIPDGPVDVVLETQPSADDVMGLPSPKTMYPPDEPELGDIRHRLESSWVPEMTTLLELEPDHLPALWDVDLLLADAPPRQRGDGTTPGYGSRYVLCEINASSIIPFPPHAPAKVADHTVAALSRSSRGAD
jgi:hypothetical protein